MSALTSLPARRRGGGILLSVLLAALMGPLLAAGIAVLSASPAQAANHQVKIAKYAYGPSGLTITQGDTVTWTNLDTVEHDVFVTNGPESFRSPMLGKGESWSHTFGTAGSYSYICSVHPDMRASVTVDAAPAPATSAPAHETHAPEAAQSAGTAPSPAATPAPTPAQTPAPTTAATIAQPAAPAAAPAAPTSTLNPLLLVAGASVAVVVFCLLLMASRPVYEVAPQPAPEPGPEPDAGPGADDQTLVQAAVAAEPAGKRGDPA